MKKILLKYTGKLFSDLHSTIVSIIVTSIILTSGFVYIFFRDLWHLLINILQISTPLWATIVLFLVLGLYVYLINRKSHASLNPNINNNICPSCNQKTFKLIRSTIRSREYECTNCGFTDKTMKESYHKANIPNKL